MNRVRRGRVIFIGGLLIFALLAVAVRVLQLQMLNGKQLTRLAYKQHRLALPIIPKRGTIYSSNMKELAITLEVDSLYAVPARMEDLEDTAGRLARLLDLDERKLTAKLLNGNSFVWIKRWLEEDEGEAIRRVSLEGVDFVKEGKRFYPHQELAGQVLGFAGLDGVGLEGVELSYDKEIRGRPGMLVAERDARGRAILPLGSKVGGEVPGHDIVLTIDENLQYIAEGELAKGVLAASAKGGSVIIMEPGTGEILAMANYPPFNPNHFWRYSPSRWRNRALTDPLEPGSTLKVFTLASALEEGIIKPDDMIYTENGRYAVSGRFIHDTQPHGWLKVSEVVKYSSNIGAAKIGLALGRERLYRYMERFGLFEPTGIDLKGEGGGLHQPLRNWSRLTTATVSFGQGIAVTPLQLANAYVALANGGLLMRPYVVKRVIDEEGRIIRENRPRVLRRVISEKTAETLADMLIGVTEAEGTGRQAALFGYEVAGKTGTAQKPSQSRRGYMEGKFVASFAGWVPARDPKLLILVVIDEPQGVRYGGVVAAPVFKAVASRALAYLRVAPDGLPYEGEAERGKGEEPAPEYLANPLEGINLVPDFRGMSLRKALKLARARGIKIRVEGSGVAVWQECEPGSPLKDEEECLVRFSSPSRTG